MKKRPLCLLIVVFTPLSIRRGDGGEAPLNTEYTDGTKPQGDTEFLTEHGIPQKLTPTCNAKCIIQNYDYFCLM